MRILVVEDDALIALSIEDILTEAGHTVVGLAPSKLRAAHLVQKTHPDMALIDIRLADGMTGIDLARDCAKFHVASLIVSALPREIDETLPEFPFLPKPFTSGMLLRSVTKLGRAIGRSEAA